MSTLSALIVLGHGAFLSGSWWVARALRGEGGRPATWFIWASLALSSLGAVPEIAAALGGTASLANTANAAGLASGLAMAVSQIGLGAVAGGRAVRDARHRSELAALALGQLAAGDAAVAEGRTDEARVRYQEQVQSAQGAGDEAAIRAGLARIAWLDYLAGRFEQARASMGWAVSGDLDAGLGSEVVLLAGCLALAGGRLDVARPAIEDAIKMADAARKPSQAALGRIALGCEHYLEGWTDSGRQYVTEQARASLEVFDRQVAGSLLLALSLAARERGDEHDAQAFAALAAGLLAGNAALAPLTGHAAHPAASPWLERPAAAVARLVLPATAAAAPVSR